MRRQRAPFGSGGARLGLSQKDGLPTRCWHVTDCGSRPSTRAKRGSSVAAPLTLVRAADWCGQDLRDCDAAGKRLALPIVFVFGHLAPLLRNFEELFLDKGIARLFGEFFALLRIGAVLFCLARHHVRPRSSAR